MYHLTLGLLGRPDSCGLTGVSSRRSIRGTSTGLCRRMRWQLCMLRLLPLWGQVRSSGQVQQCACCLWTGDVRYEGSAAVSLGVPAVAAATRACALYALVKPVIALDTTTCHAAWRPAAPIQRHLSALQGCLLIGIREQAAGACCANDVGIPSRDCSCLCPGLLLYFCYPPLQSLWTPSALAGATMRPACSHVKSLALLIIAAVALVTSHTLSSCALLASVGRKRRHCQQQQVMAPNGPFALAAALYIPSVRLLCTKATILQCPHAHQHSGGVRAMLHCKVVCDLSRAQTCCHATRRMLRQ
jgi:hypothetical protein